MHNIEHNTGLLALAQAMIEPIKHSLNYQGIGRAMLGLENASYPIRQQPVTTVMGSDSGEFFRNCATNRLIILGRIKYNLNYSNYEWPIYDQA